MTHTLRSTSALLVLLATAACASGGGSTSPATAEPARQSAAEQAAVPCTATVRGQDLSTWTEATADGITLCVPPTWRVRGNAARSGTAEVRWGPGEPPQSGATVRQRLVTASEASRMTREAGTRREFVETIGGREATIYRSRAEQRFRTRAQWPAPRMWVTGEAGSEDADEVQMTIIRTVRFSAP